LGAGENSGAPPIDAAERTRLAAEAREARRDMVLFARVLDATRANVRVLERLRELRSGRVEYSAWRDPHWPSMNISPGENRLGEEARRENRQTENRRRENRYGND
jgi:hypothetical protein